MIHRHPKRTVKRIVLLRFKSSVILLLLLLVVACFCDYVESAKNNNNNNSKYSYNHYFGRVRVRGGGSSSFEPYQMNGGLVSAVAGRDYVVMATDTRFHGEGGYDIVSRNHVSSRLWIASGGGCVGDGGGVEKEDVEEENPFSLLTKSGSSSSRHSSSSPQQKQQSSSSLSPFLLSPSIADGVTLLQHRTGLVSSPTLVGSSGCQADCEALKRYVQADLRSALYFGECCHHHHSFGEH